MVVETHVCQYRVVDSDGVTFFACERTDTSIFGQPDGGWVALCSRHAGWAAALGCRA